MSSFLGLDVGISRGVASRAWLRMCSPRRMCNGTGGLWCLAWKLWWGYLVDGGGLEFLLEGC